MKETQRIISFSSPPTESPAIAPVVPQEPVTESEPIQDSGEMKPFPVHCLPPATADMVEAVSQNTGTPVELSACCALGITAASLGKGISVASGTNRQTRGNISLMASAESGTGKSEDFRHFAQPFMEFQGERIDHWRQHELPLLDAERDVLEAERGALRKQSAKCEDSEQRDSLIAQLRDKKARLTEIENQSPALSVEDITTQKLGDMLSKCDETLASLSADAGEVVNGLLGRYNSTGRTDESLYLKAYSGDSHQVDRQGRDSIFLKSPCVTALWLTQPDKIETLLGKSELSDGGLIPRLLICHTNCQPQEIHGARPEIPEAVASRYRNLIRELLESFRLAKEPVVIQPTPEALERFTEHHNKIVRRRKSDLRDVTSFAARWNEQAWRIAVGLHAGEHGRRAGEESMDVATATAAIEIADWFAAQQLQILGAGRQAARTQRWTEIRLFAADKGKFTARDLHRETAQARDTADAVAVLAEMVEAGQLTVSDSGHVQSGGRPTAHYSLPKK